MPPEGSQLQKLSTLTVHATDSGTVVHLVNSSTVLSHTCTNRTTKIFTRSLPSYGTNLLCPVLRSPLRSSGTRPVTSLTILHAIEPRARGSAICPGPLTVVAAPAAAADNALAVVPEQFLDADERQSATPRPIHRCLGHLPRVSQPGSTSGIGNEELLRH